MKQHWTATTIAEALDLLEAAEKQLNAQILALTPGGSFRDREVVKKETSVLLAIDFDFTHIEQATAAKHQFDAIVRNGDNAETGTDNR
ncbi:hypothetical protein [Streptomyces sp. NPDC058155]|uniref:hypothetical protein n=1 Tax=Streptomyces sp. NPDC058155 TaxID=3346359 RepID=UPI0036EC5FF1